MSVQHEVGAVSADRSSEPGGAEERPDRLRLADERLGNRRVVEEHDTPVAAGDRLEPRLDRLDFARRLGVDLTQQRLAEVGKLGSGKPPTNPLAPTIPSSSPPTSCTA